MAVLPQTSSAKPRARNICLWYASPQIARAEASCRYRIGHWVEETTGADALISETLPFHALPALRALYCIRPLVTPRLRKQLTRLRARGVPLIADFDDLLFAGSVTGLPPSLTELPTRELQTRLEGYAAALDAFDTFTVSTRALARHLARLKPDAAHRVLPNGLSARWLERGKLTSRPFTPSDPKIIRYFSGSPSHDVDFAHIAAPLAGFLREHPDVRLEVVGPLNFDATPFPPEQLLRSPRVPYDHLPALLASTWLNLAPLAPNDYNECRSAIKFLEAGAFSCPTLASPNDDLRRHRELGAPVVSCESERDWYDALTALLDPETRTRLGSASEAHVMRHGMARSSVDAWLEATGVALTQRPKPAMCHAG